MKSCKVISDLIRYFNSKGLTSYAKTSESFILVLKDDKKLHFKYDPQSGEITIKNLGSYVFILNFKCFSDYTKVIRRLEKYNYLEYGLHPFTSSVKIWSEKELFNNISNDN